MCTVLLPPGDNPIAVNKYIISNVTCFKESIRVRHFDPNRNTHCKFQINIFYGFYFTLCNFIHIDADLLFFAVYWLVTVLIVTAVSTISISIFSSHSYLSFIINCCDLVWHIYSSIQSHV